MSFSLSKLLIHIHCTVLISGSLHLDFPSSNSVVFVFNGELRVKSGSHSGTKFQCLSKPEAVLVGNLDIHQKVFLHDL